MVLAGNLMAMWYWHGVMSAHEIATKAKKYWGKRSKEQRDKDRNKCWRLSPANSHAPKDMISSIHRTLERNGHGQEAQDKRR